MEIHLEQAFSKYMLIETEVDLILGESQFISTVQTASVNGGGFYINVTPYYL